MSPKSLRVPDDFTDYKHQVYMYPVYSISYSHSVVAVTTKPVTIQHQATRGPSL